MKTFLPVFITLVLFILVFTLLSTYKPSTSNNIPKIIHQTAPSDTSKWNPIWFECQKSWKEKHPDFEYMFWSDEDIEEFMKREYPDFYENVFVNYDVTIKKVDAVRYFILYHYGGIYADMDYKCQKRFFEELPTNKVSIAESRVHFDEGFQNALMISPKRHEFWPFVFDKLKDNCKVNNVLECTGPKIVSRTVMENKEYVNKLDVNDFNPYFDHYTDSPDNYRDAKCIHMHTYSWYEDDKKTKNIIYAVPSNQIGNCLRHISSMKILADFLERPFNIDISQIHSSKEKKTIKILFENYIKDNPQYNTYKQEDICEFYSPTNTDPIVEGYFKYIPQEESFGCIHIYSIIHKDMSVNDFIKRKIEFYKSLNWPEFQFKDVSNLVGVHIRMSDNFNDESKTNLNTTKQTFIEKIKTIPKPFLLCSDNQSVIEEIKMMFPNQVVLPDKLQDPELQALYEMCLLSNTKHIIGSYASTFSYESAFFKGTDLELYENNAWKIYKLNI